MKKILLLFLVIAPLFGFFLGGMKIYYDIHLSAYEGEEVEFTIKSGEGFASINGRLSQQKLIKSAKLFHRYSQFKKVMTSFKSGDYLIKPGMTMANIIDLFVSGQSVTISVTIPEGKNMYDVGKILEERSIVSYDDFIAAAKDETLIKELGIEAQTAEGYLYPETYQFTKNTPARTVVATMVRLFNQKVSSFDFTHPILKTRHEIVTLASIVEKETGASWERPMIAGVFKNRLKKKMRLQSDPTIIYHKYETWDGNIRRSDIQRTTPYNTYRIPGLPIGPISNPGAAAIQAVLEPDKHNYLFFVSKNDGTHIFSETYRQHRAAVDEWQKNPANRKGRSWRDLQEKEN